MGGIRNFVCVAVWLACSAMAMASTYRGVVTFGGLPLPGATITATQGTKTVTAVSDQSGAFQFDDLADGAWTIDVQMSLFAPVHAQVTIAPNMPAAAFDLKLMSPDQIAAQAEKEMPPVAGLPAAPTPATAAPAQGREAEGQKQAQTDAQAGAQEIPKEAEENEQSADGFLVQGSVNNAATSVYATNPAFGNTRAGARALYTGGGAATESNSALNARPYSLSGVEAAKPAFNDFTGAATLQGPINIKPWMPRGPNLFLSYQWTRNSSSVINTGVVPTQAEETGNLAGLTNPLGEPITVYQPGTNTPYPGGTGSQTVPVSTQAAALLKLYPQPNISSASDYNYQAPVLNSAHQDSMQMRLERSIGRKDDFYGGFAFQSTRSDTVNLFDFVDHTGTLGINANVHWAHRLKPRMFLYSNFVFSRLRQEVTPNFENRENVSGAAGIAGNDQDPADWGPPALSFADTTYPLSDGNSAFNRNRTDDVSESLLVYHGKHNITIGGDFRKQEYNDFFEANPRGSFGFTGAATGGTACTTAGTCGSALADFLIGVPDTSAIAYGNADKYFREPVYAAWFTDDWRILPILTINAGARWDYGAPITELFGRLVNLDVASGFTNVAPVLGSAPVGSLTNQHYPAALMRPERDMIEPRIGLTWRPIPASTVVIRAGYGIYPDTSVYQNIVLSMAQQSPLSTSLSVQNSSACPLTLANGFTPCATITSDTYGINPNFRIGYVQTWQLSVQRDLPFALQLTATYNGFKGSHGPQEILPNSYELGAPQPACPAGDTCPSGFVYETSDGNSIRHAGQVQLRRRLRGGFGAQLAYTFSKSIDDDAYLGGVGHVTASSGGQAQSASLSVPTSAIAQNWLDPRAERSLSTFDQRNLLSAQAQYTSGQGLEGGTLLGGWRGKALKEWTLLGNVSYGSGFPETPLYPAAVPGTGFTNIIRPELVAGESIYSSGSQAHLNAAAYTEPVGEWGSAGRDSITGPNQLTFSSSLARTFRPTKSKVYLDFAINSTNTFNHVTYSGWNTSLTNDQFGLPMGANAMRSVQTEIHVRFQ